MTDQLRADCLGVAGHPLLRTPNVDALAEQGVRFTSAYTTSPLCVPARASITTGLYPHNNNIWQGDQTVPLDADTYLHRLKDVGYRTCSIGKNHLYPMENCNLFLNHPKYNAIGFDHIEDLSGTWGIIEGESVYVDYLKSQGLHERLANYLKDLEEKPDEVRRFIAEPLPIDAQHYIDAFIGRRVEKYVDEYDGDKPTFVYAGFQGPHEPWDAPKEYAERYPLSEIPEPIPEKPPGDWLPGSSLDYQRWAQYYQPPSERAGKAIVAAYLGKIAMIDESVGRILAAYERKGWLENTVVIFSTDHGEMLNDLGRVSKSIFYESATHIPLIVRLPEHSRHQGMRGTVDDRLEESIDIHATILDVAGATPWDHQDSLSLLSGPERQNVLGEVHAHYMLRSREWKIVVGRQGETLQLFDLLEDPQEQVNLCQHPGYREQELHMRSLLLARITRDTFRDSNIDPELSSHSIEGLTHHSFKQEVAE